MDKEVEKENGMKNIIDKLKLAMNSKKIKYIFVVLLCLIVVVIFLSSFKTTSKTNTSVQSINYSGNSSWQSYCESQEHRLEYILGSVKGVSDVKVFVMVDASPTITYLENKTNSTTSSANQTIQTTAVEIRNGTITMPVVVVENLPKIIGVLIVAGGASDIKLKNTLTNVVSSIMKVHN